VPTYANTKIVKTELQYKLAKFSNTSFLAHRPWSLRRHRGSLQRRENLQAATQMISQTEQRRKVIICSWDIQILLGAKKSCRDFTAIPFYYNSKPVTKISQQKPLYICYHITYNHCPAGLQ